MAQFEIKINGVQKAISEVEALVEKLNVLEAKIESLSSKHIEIQMSGLDANVNVDTNSSNNVTSNVSALREEDALLKQIEQTEEKINEVRRDEYQELLHQKDILKDVKKEGASRFAEDNLAVKEYSNTMAGLKDRLADIKKAMQFREIGSDGFNKLVDEANEINTKLKDIESSYGQFGRNVGNYANGVAEGMQKIKVTVGGVDREFNSAREASRELGNELKTMAINGQQGTKEFKEMQKAVAQLNSGIKDATVSSSAMDNMLDTLQSFAAIGSVTQGFSALFGFDDTEIEKSIQKLVALQNVMKGIEELQQQMNSGEGLGGWLAKGNDAIDSFVEKLFGAKEATEAVSDAADTAKSATEALGTVTKGTTTATEGLTAAQNGQTVATKGATVATKGLSLALKAIGIGLVISLVATLITYWDDLVEWFEDTIPALKNLSTWFDKLRAVAVGVGTAIVNYMVQPTLTLGKVIKAAISGNFSDIPKIIGEGINKTFNVVQNFQKGYNKETERQNNEHNKKMLQQQKEANEEWLKDEEAKNGKSLKLTTSYNKKQIALIDKQLANEKKGSEKYKELLKERREYERKQWAAEREDRDKNNKKNAASAKKAAQEQEKIEKNAQNARLNLLRDGLTKTIAQLRINRMKELDEAKENGIQIYDINRKYDDLEFKARQEYFNKVLDQYKKFNDDLKKQTSENRDMALSNSSMKLQNDTEEKRRNIVTSDDQVMIKALTYDYKNIYNYTTATKEKMDDIFDEYQRYKKIVDNYIVEYKSIDKLLENYQSRIDEETKLYEEMKVLVEKIKVDYGDIDTYLNSGSEEAQKWIQYFGSIENAANKLSNLDYFEKDIEDMKFMKSEVEKVVKFVEDFEKEYPTIANMTLQKTAAEGISIRLNAEEKYYKELQKINKDFIDKQSKQQLEAIGNRKQKELDALKEIEDKRLGRGFLSNERNGTNFENIGSKTQEYIKKYNTLVDNPSEDSIRNLTKYLDEARAEFDKYIDDVTEKAQKGEITLEQFNNNLGGEYVQTYITVRKGYEEFIKEYNKLSKTEQESRKLEFNEWKEQYNNAFSNYIENVNSQLTASTNKRNLIEKKASEESRKLNAETKEKLAQEDEKSFNSRLNMLSNFIETVDQSLSSIDNVSFKEATNIISNAEMVHGELSSIFTQIRTELQMAFNAGNIDFEAFNKLEEYMNSLGLQLGDLQRNLGKDAIEKLIEKKVSEINGYVQQFTQATMEAFQSLWDYLDAEFQAQMEELDKEIDEIQDKYDKIEDITRQHKDNIDAIEDELSTARGDRRQMLIDALNTEIQAQRDAATEEKRLEKQKEALEKKRETEEEEQKKKQHERDVMQAFVNWHLSISNALTTQPFIPMALIAASIATTLGAIQFALVKSAKYKDGGVIQGKSHSQGGVKVMGGQVEVEGNEFITNKITTQKNVDVLEYINSKKRKLNLEDFIDFYGANKKSITSKALPKTKFASGGQIPTLRTDIDVNDKVINALDAYANRPYYVAVREIETVQDDLKQVKVISGYE